MDFSKHAKTRSQQRGIPITAIELIVEYGEPREAMGNAHRYEVKADIIPKIQSRLKGLLHQIEKLKGKVVIVSEDGAVITTYHK